MVEYGACEQTDSLWHLSVKGKNMSNLIVVTFDNPEEAGKVRKSLKSIEREGLLRLDDSAVMD